MTQPHATPLPAALSDPRGGVFFLHGEEEFLREQATEQLAEAHLEPGTRDFNLDQLRGGEISGDELASLLATPPMMAEWRVVVVRDAQGLPARARDTVEALIKDPPPGLALILSAAIPAGSQARFYTLLRTHARASEFARVDEMDAPGWLMEQASARGKEFDAEAARMLVAAIGTDLGPLASELAKLVEYVGDRPRITPANVRAVGGSVARQDRWAWFDLVGERRLGEARRHLPTLLDAGENGVGLIIGMTAQLLRIGLACAGGQAALEQALPPRQRWLARRVLTQSRRWTLPEVDAAASELLRADRLLKSASLSDAQAMEELLLRLETLRIPRNTAA